MKALDDDQAVLEQLQLCLVERQIQAGFHTLDTFLKAGSFQPASMRLGVPFLFCLAQWIDLGYSPAASLDELLSSSLATDRAAMPTQSFLKLRMIEALLCMQTQSFARAIFLLKSVIDSNDAILSAYETFVAHFWLGRAQRLGGDFEGSLQHIRKAVQLAAALKASKLVAVARIHESWLVFHKGEGEWALKLLDEAEQELIPTGHALSLANISAARGRFIRSSGKYAEALRHFNRAIDIYSIDHSNHPNLARAFVNAAYVKRLMALELHPKARNGTASATTHRLFQQITREALTLLEKASAIYQNQQHQGGTGAVSVNTGYLYLESGDIERAAMTADEAYGLGEVKSDLVLMARARILQGSVELAICEEQLDDQSELGSHAIAAAKHADHAILLASKTQNRRLQAASHIVRGLIAADESNLDWTLARSSATKAAALLGEYDRDHLFRELQGLNLKITRSAAVEEIMRAWCNGELSGKPYQQIEEEFAGIVIPKVWVKMDRNVSRVAKELKISPKKIRRILRAAKIVSDE